MGLKQQFSPVGEEFVLKPSNIGMSRPSLDLNITTFKGPAPSLRSDSREDNSFAACMPYPPGLNRRRTEEFAGIFLSLSF